MPQLASLHPHCSHLHCSYLHRLQDCTAFPPLQESRKLCAITTIEWLDSKLLTSASRESFFDLLLLPDSDAASGKVDVDEDRRHMGWSARALHPEHISNCMLKREKHNLNELSYETVFDIIRSLLAMGISISEAYVDTLGKAETYQARLSKLFPTISFTVRSKADSIYPVVGAASIVAKVLRDDILRAVFNIAASGYPGDAQTVSWLHSNSHKVFGFPSVVRFSWSSCASILATKCCPVIWADGHNGGEGDDSIAARQCNTEATSKKRAKGVDRDGGMLSGPQKRPSSLFGMVSCSLF